MLKGINQWCFPKGTPIDQIFEHCQKAGFDALELNLQRTASAPGITLESTLAELEQIGKLARAHQIQLRSISNGLMYENSLSSQDPELRKKGFDIVIRQLEVANVLGMDTALVVPVFVNDSGTAYNEGYERSQEMVRELAVVAERLQVHIGIENVWNKIFYSPLEMVKFIDEVDSPYVGAYFDVGNILNFGFPEQWIRILGSRIRKVHVKDFRREVGTAYGVVTLLSGDVNWIEVRKALQEIGYKDTLTAELNAYANAPFQLAYDTARHLDVIIHGGER